MHTTGTTGRTLPDSISAFSYDSLGRTVSRTINGSSNQVSWVYDVIDRILSEKSPLGSNPFTYTYVDNTSGSSKGDPRLESATYPNSQVSSFAYHPNILDQHLEQILNLNPISNVLSQFNHAYDSSGQIRQWQQQQNSSNAHFSLDYDFARQLVSAQSDSGSSFKAYISGTPHAGDVVSITAYDASLTGTTPVGQETADYTVAPGDDADDIATNLAGNIATAMSNISVTASATGPTIYIGAAATHATQFTSQVSGMAATTTISLSGSNAIHPLHRQLSYAYDCASNRIGMQTDATGSFPTGLIITAKQSKYNNVNQLIETAAGGPIKFQGTTTNPIKGAAFNVNQTATISATSITPGDVLTISVHDRRLTEGRNINYVVQIGDTTASITASFEAAINGDPVLSPLGVTADANGSALTLTSASSNPTSYTQAVSTGATESIALSSHKPVTAKVSPSTQFTGYPALNLGNNEVSVTAVSGGGTAATNSYLVTISSASGTSFAYDSNGNLENDGANTYQWDAENRLLRIDYPGSNNNTEFQYDPLGRCVKIIETEDASPSPTVTVKQFVWCGNDRCEVRDGSGNLLKQYFALGQVNVTGGTPTNYFYTKDHLGSIREMTNNSGAIVWQQSFDPFGQPATPIVSTIQPDMGFAGMYVHLRSGLNLTLFRAYSPPLGRWLSRDPVGESAGTNLYAYVGNEPIGRTDPHGLLFGGLVNAGECFGQSALEHYAAQVNANPMDVGAWVGGTFAALWTPSTSDNTASTLVSALIPNLTTWAKNPVLYEIGQKTLPAAEFAALPQGVSAIERGAAIVQQQGWLKALLPRATGAYAQTWNTGLTPGGNLLVIWGTNFGSKALAKSLGKDPCSDPCGGK